MRATVNGTVVAEAPESELVRIEGNWYFPPSAVVDGALAKSPTAYTCPWKGAAQYWDVVTLRHGLGRRLELPRPLPVGRGAGGHGLRRLCRVLARGHRRGLTHDPRPGRRADAARDAAVHHHLPEDAGELRQVLPDNPDFLTHRDGTITTLRARVPSLTAGHA